MQAIVVTEHGGPEVLALQEFPDPQAGDGQVVVDVAAAGVNYRDIYERQGPGYAPGAPPFVAGVEGAGTVAATGERVAWVDGKGSYAQKVAIDAERLVPIPDGVSEQDAAAAMLQGMTAHYLAVSTYPIADGDRVVVHAGAGGVGLLLIQIAKLRGAHVIATTSTPEKAELARGAGADEAIGYDELGDDTGAAVVYDGVGRATWDRSLAALGRRGMLVLYGAASGPPEPFAPGELVKGSKYLTRPTLVDYVATREELLERAADVFGWMAAGQLDVRIGGRYPLAEAAQAQTDLEARRTTGKLILEPPA